MRRATAVLAAAALTVAVSGPPGDASTTRHTARVVDRVTTTDKVIFLTIDDGSYREPGVLEFLKANHIPVTAFLSTKTVLRGELGPSYFRQVRALGDGVQDHTIDHVHLRGLSYTRQKQEICGAASVITGWVGHRPRLFRPPYGEYDKTTLQAAKACGMNQVILWTANATDGVWQVQGGKLKPGFIVLMHWRPQLLQDLQRTLAYAKAAGLKPALLEDYVK